MAKHVLFPPKHDVSSISRPLKEREREVSERFEDHRRICPTCDSLRNLCKDGQLFADALLTKLHAYKGRFHSTNFSLDLDILVEVPAKYKFYIELLSTRLVEKQRQPWRFDNQGLAYV